MTSTKFPHSWCSAPMPQCFDSISTNGIKTKQKDYLATGNLPIVDQGQELVGGYTNDATKAVHIDPPCVVFGDHTKTVKLLKFPFAPGADGVKVLKPKDFIDTALFSLFLKVIAVKIPDKGYARHFQHVCKETFPLPPLAEQHRIVAKIDELFSDLDAGIASLKKAKEQLKTYRQSVLKWAFEGKLTEEWRKQNKPEPASQLLKRIKAEREKKYKRECEKAKKEGKRPPRKMKELPPISEDELAELPKLPEGWMWTRLGSLPTVVFDGPFGSNLKTSDYVDQPGVRVIRLENIGFLQFREEKYSYVTTEKYERISKHTVYPGDIVFSSFIADGTRAVIIPPLFDKAVNKADCFCVWTISDDVSARHLHLFLSSKTTYNQLVSLVHGATRPRINTTQLKYCLVPVCDRNEQDQVALEIGTRLSEADNLEKSIEETLAKSQTLRQSILRQAFEGKLVPQDPDDEPAEKLLSRIAAQTPCHAPKARPTKANRKAKA